MKLLFVGTGSIAKRHIRNLQIIGKERNLKFLIDAFHHRDIREKIEGICKEYCSTTDVPDDYDVIFITNPTSMHLQTLQQFHEKGKHFFIEKPIVSTNQINEAKEFRLRDNSVYYVACPLRYNAVIRYIKNNIDPDEVISVRCISSSYLPEWRPGIDYRNTYSAHKEMGGGVSIDLIHEWDYLVHLFGWPEKVLSMIGKKSSLEIDSDDYALYIADYNDKIIELHLDYFGRKVIREIELFTGMETIIGDIIHNRIENLTTGEIIDFREERDDIQRSEMNHFLDMILNEDKREECFNHAVRVLELTQGNV